MSPTDCGVTEVTDMSSGSFLFSCKVFVSHSDVIFSGAIGNRLGNSSDALYLGNKLTRVELIHPFTMVLVSGLI